MKARRTTVAAAATGKSVAMPTKTDEINNKYNAQQVDI
jgi:hypothetical protein